jgi:hypothetical protein
MGRRGNRRNQGFPAYILDFATQNSLGLRSKALISEYNLLW